jgi:UDP-N-acetylglucosamine--N-acetylmuramyl-(pentapeptide) pyrophosphoryl-undecaprenol N-acetylglucosamine transferase
MGIIITSMNKQRSICFVAGKSGGHIVPCLTIAQQEYSEDNILFFSTDTSLDKALLSSQSLISQYIRLPLGRFSAIPLYRHLQIAWRLTKSFVQSLYHLYKHKPKKLISTGGLVALPVCLAAVLLRIPIELYELNAVPGKAIKALAPYAQTIFVCFEEAKKYFFQYNCVYKSYPIRFNNIHKQISKERVCKELGLDILKKTIFIMGGSQGSIQLNNAVKKYIETSKNLNCLQIIHQTGAQDQTNWQKFYANHTIPAIIFDYSDNVASYYIAADLIIARAGAGLLFEILFFEKPSIIIPLEAYTTSHQIDNAYAITKKHSALFTVIRQQELTDNNTLQACLDTFIKSSSPFIKSIQKNPAQSEA